MSKILFVQPNVGFKGHTWEALGIGYLIAYAKENVPDAEFSFYSGFYDSDDDIVKAGKDVDFACFSCTSPQFAHGVKLARKIKENNPYVRTIFGGVHVSCVPYEIVKNECIDVVVQGEGEKALVHILKSEHVGWKRIIKCECVESLDELPFPDRDAIKVERNITQAYKDNGRRITSILSSRGCPYDCKFCASKSLWGRGARMRTAYNVLSEMCEVVDQYKLDMIKFADDTFTISKSRVLEFCEKKKMVCDVPFGANAHVGSINEKIIKALAEANCEELWFGVESGSDRIRAEMGKSATKRQIVDAFHLCKKYGILTRAYFMLGWPSETREDIKKTEKLCDELDPDVVGFTILAPYPGSELYDEEKMGNVDWSKVDEYGNDLMRTAELTNEELKEEQRRLVEKHEEKICYRQNKQAV